MASPAVTAALEDIATKVVKPVLEPIAKSLETLGQVLKEVVPKNFGTEYSFPLYRQEGWQPSAFPYLEVIILFSLAFFIFESWLSIRNHLRIHIKKPPVAVSSRGLASLLDHHKKDVVLCLLRFIPRKQ